MIAFVNHGILFWKLLLFWKNTFLGDLTLSRPCCVLHNAFPPPPRQHTQQAGLEANANVGRVAS